MTFVLLDKPIKKGDSEYIRMTNKDYKTCNSKGKYTPSPKLSHTLYCTRAKGHRGLHVAHDSFEEMVATWSEEDCNK